MNFLCMSSLQAVCCEDHLHCCPHGTICNLAASTCDDPTYNTAVTPWLRNEPAFSLQSDNNKCDETTSCPGNSTCCGAAGGEWACCPLAEVKNDLCFSYRFIKKKKKLVSKTVTNFTSCLHLRLCAATTTSTAAPMIQHATWRLKPVRILSVLFLQFPGWRSSLLWLLRLGMRTVTDKPCVQGARPAVRRLLDCGPVVRYLRSVFCEPLLLTDVKSLIENVCFVSFFIDENNLVRERHVCS